MRFAGIACVLALVYAPLALAEPYEFYACNFKEGRGEADLDKWIVQWKAVADKLKSPGYAAVVLTPQYAGNEDTPDFFWMGTWPDASAMGAVLKEWVEEGLGTAVSEAGDKIMDCEAASLWWGRKVYGGK
jgi:hypothetical protein